VKSERSLKKPKYILHGLSGEESDERSSRDPKLSVWKSKYNGGAAKKKVHRPAPGKGRNKQNGEKRCARRERGGKDGN